MLGLRGSSPSGLGCCKSRRRSTDRGTFGPASVWVSGALGPRGSSRLRVQFIWFGCWALLLIWLGMLGLEFAGPVHLVWMLALFGSSSSGLRCWVFAGPDVVLVAGSCTCWSSSSDVRHFAEFVNGRSILLERYAAGPHSRGFGMLGYCSHRTGHCGNCRTSMSAFVYCAG